MTFNYCTINQDRIIVGQSINDNFGYSVSADGDINNDGFNDLIIGALGQNGNRGAAYVFYGNNLLADTNATNANITFTDTCKLYKSIIKLFNKLFFMHQY